METSLAYPTIGRRFEESKEFLPNNHEQALVVDRHSDWDLDQERYQISNSTGHQ
jgi:hypothetical protein